MSSNYRAFVSYSHAADGQLAPALHSALQKFGKAWYRRQALRIFRDQSSLNVNPALWTSIEHALNNADHFIYLASPEAARSSWVRKEVSYWCEHNPDKPILLVLTEGELVWDQESVRFDTTQSSALMDQLINHYKEEPLFLDLRWARNQQHLSLSHPRFREAVAELSAAIQGRPKDELIGEAVWQHRRTMRVAWSAVAALVVLSVSAVLAAWFALRQAQVAESQTEIALMQKSAAERERAIALAGRLASEANLVRRDRPEDLSLSVLLAIESLRINRTAEGERALRSGLRLLPPPIATATHGERVTDVMFSPDRNYLATGSADGTVKIIDVTTGDTLRTLQHEDAPGVPATNADGGFSWRAPGYGAEVRDVAISNDGHWVATANNDGNARLWAMPDDTATLVMKHGDKVVSVAFHPDKQFLATGSKDGTARMWNLENGTETLRATHAEEVREVRFSPDGRYLAAISTSGGIDLWNLEQGNKRVSWPSGGFAGLGLAFDAESSSLATISDNAVTIWSLETRESRVRVEHHDYAGNAPMQHFTWLNDVEFSPNGKYLATAGRDYTARLWDATNGQEIVRLLHRAAVTSVRFGPDSRVLLTASADATARLWEIPSGSERLRVVHAGAVDTIDMSADGQRLASGDSAGNVKIWGAQPGDQVVRLPHTEDVVTVAYSNDGDYIASADDKGSVRFWTASGALIGVAISPPVWRTDHLLFSHDTSRLIGQNSRDSYLLDVPTGKRAVRVTTWRDTTDLVISPKYLAGRTKAGDGRVFDAGNGAEVTRLRPEDGIHDVRLSTGGEFLLTMRSHGTVRVYSLPGGSEIFKLSVSDVRRDGIAVSPKGDLLAVATGNEVAIWDVHAGTQRILLATDQGARALWFSPAGDRLVILNRDNVVLHDTQTGDCVGRLQHQGEIRAHKLGLWRGVTMSEDNNVIATLSGGNVRVWSLSDGTQYAEVGDGGITAMTFSPDGHWLLTGDKDNNGIVWRWRAPDLVDTACARVGRDLTETEWDTFLGSTPWRPTCGSGEQRVTDVSASTGIPAL